MGILKLIDVFAVCSGTTGLYPLNIGITVNLNDISSGDPIKIYHYHCKHCIISWFSDRTSGTSYDWKNFP